MQSPKGEGGRIKDEGGRRKDEDGLVRRDPKGEGGDAEPSILN
jgi:hypothetical protein